MAGAFAGVLAVTLLVPASSASAAPVLTMTGDLPIWYPRQVPLSTTGQTTRISVVVSSSEPVTVSARSFDNSLTIADPQRSLGATTQHTTVSFEVAAVTAGFHQLSVQMDGSSGPPYDSVALQYDYVWASGSPVPASVPGAGTLRQQVFGYQAPGGPARLLDFVSPDFVYLGLPANGQPTCTQEGSGCVHYWVGPPPAQVVQIGTGIVGAVHRGGFYSDGFVPPGPATGTPYGRYDFITPLYYVSPRSGLRGTYAYTDRSRTSGLTREKVTFLKYSGNLAGDYRLTYAYAGGRKRTLEGKFRVEKGGAITFRDDRGRVVQRGTVLVTGRALPCALEGTCRAAQARVKRGIWLVLSGRKGNRPDGNLLQQLR